MRDIKITILSDGTAQIEEPFCFCGEHNAARLCITLNDELKTDASYYLLSFDVYGLSRRIVSNIISGANSTPAYITGGVIYCPLPEALTSTGELTVQVEAHKRNDLEVTRITKSAVFSLICVNALRADSILMSLGRFVTCLNFASFSSASIPPSFAIRRANCIPSLRPLK